MRQYEVAVVLHPDLEIDLERATAKIETVITGLGGKIEKKDNWGKRKLAYKIKKQDWGLYVFYQVSLDPAQVQPLDNTLRITDEVMRYLVVSLEDVKAINKPKSDPTKVKSTKTDKTQSKAEDEVQE
ncbi:30S ribosomal protein S6 [bacterium]|nr:30S ribosomal protein S6 [bacterium]